MNLSNVSASLRIGVSGPRDRLFAELFDELDESWVAGVPRLANVFERQRGGHQRGSVKATAGHVAGCSVNRCDRGGCLLPDLWSRKAHGTAGRGGDRSTAEPRPAGLFQTACTGAGRPAESGAGTAFPATRA